MLTESIEEYIDTLESFKKRKFSAQLDLIHLKIFAALKSNLLNPKIASYFTQKPLDFDLTQIPEDPEKIKKFLADYYASMPLKGYELEPDNVTQIKKLLNALYYLHSTFCDLEQIDLKKDVITSWSHLKSLYGKTIDIVYEASFLLTHLDVDVQDMFQEELQFLYPVIGKVNTLVAQRTEETKLLAKEFEKYPLSYKVGEVTGTALEQMQPSSGTLDYGFLTQFSAILPSYIDRVTQYIEQYSSQLIKQEPSLNTAKLEELHHTALALLNDLEKLRGNSLFISLKFINYIHIIRNIITLATSSIEQIGHLSDSSQDAIRDNLAQLKYVVLPQLFGLVDKIEVNCMLKPGTLSVPLMNKVKLLYETLIFYAKKPVDFAKKGAELLSIEDNRFLALRLDHTYRRIDKANIDLFKIKKAEEACARFYAILKNDAYKALPLNKFPKEAKEQLIEEYKIIKPYMMQVDADLHEEIMNALLDKVSITGLFTSVWQWFNSTPESYLQGILAKEEPLKKLITKKINTQLFQIELNTSLITSIQKETDLILFPYSDVTSVITNEQLAKMSPVDFPLELEEQLYINDETIPLRLIDEDNPALEYSSQGLNKIITNPEQLSADQTLVLYHWYNTKLSRFQKAKTAYNQFTTLLAEQIKEHYPIPAHVLNFNQLKEQNKEKLRTLYQQFRTYLTSGVPQGMKDQLAGFDAFLNPVVGTTTPFAPPIIADFEKLHIHFTDFFNEAELNWNKKTQFYLKQAKHKLTSEEQDVFFLDESRALVDSPTPLQFKKEPGKKLVSDPAQLTANQALTLYQWYRNKRNKFEAARNAYTQFITLLEEQAQQHISQHGPTLTLAHLSPETKVEYRKLYNLFQPYFINGIAKIHGIPVQDKKRALAFDEYLARSFAEDKEASGDEITSQESMLDIFKKYDEHFQRYFTQMDLSWKTKSQFYLELAQEKFNEENKHLPLEQDTNADRAHYLLKHTHYSKFIYEFRQVVQGFTATFNSSMRAELTMQTTGIPFPELEDKFLAASQSKQVLAIKELYNGLYHLEQIVRQLENLNDKSYKSVYVYYLMIAYKHANTIVNLSQNLAEDPHFHLISSSLLEKAQNIWATIQENLAAYQESAIEVAPLDKAVEYNGLWYALNAFNVLPKHIRSLRNTTFLTQQDLDELHISAKKATLTIEAMVNNSDSYFKLFLQAPNIISLFGEFKGRLKEFISTAHDAAMSNLDQFNTHIFTPMLLEADEWESKLGLTPGLVSGPLKTMLNEYFKGLLIPLKLPSKTHIALVCDKAPIKERIRITQQKITEAQQHAQKTEHTYAHLRTLYTLVKEHEDLTKGFFIADTKRAAELIEEIKASYKETLPKLVSLKKHLKFEPTEKLQEQDKRFDELLNASLKEYEPKLSDLRSLIKMSYAHYVALKKTYTMQINTFQEQLGYLNQLDANQDKANEQFILGYTTDSFDKQSKELAYRHVGLQYCDKEYAAKLEAYLLKFKEGIITKSKSEADINFSIRELLKEKIRDFEQQNFAMYYQLDNIGVALAQFKNYFSLSGLAITKNNSLFENDETLAKKSAEISKLVLIAENEHLKVEDRINQIKFQVIQNPSFSRIILEQKQVDTLSFAYLKLCFLYLLEALHLYTPDKKVRLNDLKKAVSVEPSITHLTKRFGLFTGVNNPEIVPSQPQKKKGPPIIAEELPETPTIPPV